MRMFLLLRYMKRFMSPKARSVGRLVRLPGLRIGFWRPIRTQRRSRRASVRKAMSCDHWCLTCRRYQSAVLGRKPIARVVARLPIKSRKGRRIAASRASFRKNHAPYPRAKPTVCAVTMPKSRNAATAVIALLVCCRLHRASWTGVDARRVIAFPSGRANLTRALGSRRHFFRPCIGLSNAYIRPSLICRPSARDPKAACLQSWHSDVR